MPSPLVWLLLSSQVAVQTPDPIAVATPALALTAAAVATGTDWYLLGIPPAVWFACLAGAMFGATWFEPERKVAKPWAILTTFAAGLVLGTGIAEFAKLSLWQHATAGFVASAWPVIIAQAVRDSIIGALQRLIGKKDER